MRTHINTQMLNYDELSKTELLDLWNKTYEELRNTSPFTNYEKWAVLQRQVDDIVEAYYKDFDGIVRLEQIETMSKHISNSK